MHPLGKPRQQTVRRNQAKRDQVSGQGEVQPSTRSAGMALALICTAQFVLQLDFSIVNVALPTIQRELHFQPADLQWIVTGYAMTFGSLLLIGGRAADLFGRRRLLQIGLLVFMV